MTWLLIAIFAYFLNAVAVTVDKFLIEKKIPNPAVYAFFISVLSLLAVVIAPFGFHLYSFNQIIIALLAGILFAFALLFMFKALSRNEASRISPFMGGLQPIFIFILAFFFLGEALAPNAFLAFILIILGTVVISWQKGKMDKTSYLFALISTLLFAVSYTVNKYAFVNQDFISGFVWTRIGAFLGALLIILPPKNLKAVIKEFKKPKKGARPLFLIGQICGALSFILINYVIAISPSVAVVNALQGLQYVFLLLIVLFLAKKFPKILEEKFALKVLIQKIIAIALLLIGLILLFV
ncbi:MAG: EamA family transporter [Patescibacteria group bacterium]|mgnify:CR=1 FL=1